MNVIAVRHAAVDNLGLLASLLEDLGVETTYVWNWGLQKRAAEIADLVEFLGGSINVNDGVELWLVGHTGEIAQTPGVPVVDLRADTGQHGSALTIAAAEVLQRRFAAIGFSR
jgi:hypothetical protein